MGELSPAALGKYRFFSDLTEDSRATLVDKLRSIAFPAGSEIVRQGALREAFFFLKEGEVELSTRTKPDQPATLSRVKSGAHSGEMPFLTCSPASSSLTAVTETTVYELLRTDFENVLLNEYALKSEGLVEGASSARFVLLRSLQPLALLSSDKVLALADRLTEKTFGPGEDIILQGEKGDCYYIIKTGSVSVLKRHKQSGEVSEVAVLGKGDGFGEEALIRDDPRNATIRTRETTTVLVLDKNDFLHFMKASFVESTFPEEIDLTRLDDYVFVDARIPPEYEEEHIEGAINIPLEVLRQKYSQFDPAKEYITYCTNDSRGMVAAFLLKNHGFRAKCLRGGVSGWTGRVVTGREGVHLPESEGR